MVTDPEYGGPAATDYPAHAATRTPDPEALILDGGDNTVPPGAVALDAAAVVGADDGGGRVVLTVFNLSDASMVGVTLEARLPAGTRYRETLGTATDIHVVVAEPVGDVGDRVSLRLPDLPARAVAGPFAFTVSGPPAPLVATLTWDGGESTEDVQQAIDVDFPLEGTAVTVGRLLAPSGGVAAAAIDPATMGRIVTVTQADEEPPAGWGAWWAAVAEVDGLEGDRVLLRLPARGPLAPGLPVSVLLRPPGGAWDQVPARGAVTSDGHHVVVAVDRPGTYAAGVPHDVLDQRVVELKRNRVRGLRTIHARMEAGLAEGALDVGPAGDHRTVHYLTRLGGELFTRWRLAYEHEGAQAVLSCGSGGCIVTSDGKPAACPISDAHCTVLSDTRMCSLLGYRIECVPARADAPGDPRLVHKTLCHGRPCLVDHDLRVLVDGTGAPGPGAEPGLVRTGYLALDGLLVHVTTVTDHFDNWVLVGP